MSTRHSHNSKFEPTLIMRHWGNKNSFPSVQTSWVCQTHLRWFCKNDLTRVIDCKLSHSVKKRNSSLFFTTSFESSHAIVTESSHVITT